MIVQQLKKALNDSFEFFYRTAFEIKKILMDQKIKGVPVFLRNV